MRSPLWCRDLLLSCEILHRECFWQLQVLAQSYISTQQLTDRDYDTFRNILAGGRAARVCQAEE